jgi:pyroglutamyl-peptidase
MSATVRPILLTGFEPFGGETINPSAEVARALHGRRIGGAPVVAVQLPCAFGQAIAVLRDALAAHRPQLVLALGQAGGRCDLALERVAINIDDARIADNRGAQPIDEPVVADGPAAYFSTLPVKAMVAAMRQAGHPASLSHSAGTFVCNHVFYGLQHALAGQPGVRSGFMHLPYLPEQAARHAGAPSLALATMVDGVAAALAAAMATARDAKVSEGALD